MSDKPPRPSQTQKPKQKELFPLVLLMLYTFVCSVVLALVTKRFFFEPDPGDPIEITESKSLAFELFGELEVEGQKLEAKLRMPFSTALKHGEKLYANYLKDMGLSPEHYQIFELELSNHFDEQSFSLDNVAGFLQLQDKKGKQYKNIKIPVTAKEEQTQRRLFQRLPQGSLPSISRRYYWVLFEKNFDFVSLESGELKLSHEEVIDLEFQAFEH